MADTNGDMPEQKRFQLNPEALENVPPEAREEIELVECWVKEHPWPQRLGEGILHHLAGEFAGILIGTGLVLGGVVHPKSPEPGLPALACIVPVGAQRPGERTIYRLVPCPPVDDSAQTLPSGDGPG